MIKESSIYLRVKMKIVYFLSKFNNNHTYSFCLMIDGNPFEGVNSQPIEFQLCTIPIWLPSYYGLELIQSPLPRFPIKKLSRIVVHDKRSSKTLVDGILIEARLNSCIKHLFSFNSPISIACSHSYSTN